MASSEADRRFRATRHHAQARTTLWMRYGCVLACSEAARGVLRAAERRCKGAGSAGVRRVAAVEGAQLRIAHFTPRHELDRFVK